MDGDMGDREAAAADESILHGVGDVVAFFHSEERINFDVNLDEQGQAAASKVAFIQTQHTGHGSGETAHFQSE